MKILLVAPCPFFQERGTPIAVRILCETLCESGHTVDLLTYHVGANVSVPGLTIIRIPRLPLIRDVPIGLSWQKVICDIFLTAYLLVRTIRGKYDVIHAVEESVFPSIIAKVFHRSRLIYDMDSSLADQLMEKWNYLRAIGPVLKGFENLAIRRSDHIVAVCDDLADRVREIDVKKPVTVLQDVPLTLETAAEPVEELRSSCSLPGLIVLYVGNLEGYQGIDLLLEGFARLENSERADLVIIGGNSSDIRTYRRKAQDLGVEKTTHLLGPRPVAHLPAYLKQASILVSPRRSGTNTPMKIYSYLASGRPILATNIKSHTQVLDSTCAVLVEPTSDGISNGLECLIVDSNLRERIGKAAQNRCESHYSLSVYKEKVAFAYEQIRNRTTDD